MYCSLPSASFDFGSGMVGVIRNKAPSPQRTEQSDGVAAREGAAKLIWGPAWSDSGERDLSTTS